MFTAWCRPIWITGLHQYEAVERCAETYPNHTPMCSWAGNHLPRYGGGNRPLCPGAEGHRRPSRRPDHHGYANCPQAVIMFYAINLVGATANMIHPLSSEKEIEFT